MEPPKPFREGDRDILRHAAIAVGNDRWADRLRELADLAAVSLSERPEAPNGLRDALSMVWPHDGIDHLRRRGGDRTVCGLAIGPDWWTADATFTADNLPKTCCVECRRSVREIGLVASPEVPSDPEEPSGFEQAMAKRSPEEQAEIRAQMDEQRAQMRVFMAATGHKEAMLRIADAISGPVMCGGCGNRVFGLGEDYERDEGPACAICDPAKFARYIVAAITSPAPREASGETPE